MLMLTACAPTEASGDATVLVALADDEILLAPPSVPDGRIVFDTENTSTALVHEIEVFSGAIDGVLPPVANSVADTAGLTLIDEVEDIVPGASATLTIDLTPGTYLVICNLPAHFEAGMWAYLTVTG
ncbi:MAG: hypothetical protein HZA58_04750 [Acidimicrobiia bacterium]|nr:hypothetical protein [Acidimicrobiia bacterium]